MRKWNRVVSKYHIFIITLLLIFMAMPLSRAFSSGDSGTIQVIQLKNEITRAMSAYIDREIAQANESGAEGIIIEITTLGGLVDSALDIKESIFNSNIRVVVLIRDR